MPAISRGAVADRDGHPIGLLQRLDLEPFLERAGDRLLGVDVLARLGHLARERQVLLVRDGQDHAFDLRVGQHGGEVGGRRDPKFLLERGALVFRAAVAGDDR